MAELKNLRCLVGYYLIDRKNNNDYPGRIEDILPWKLSNTPEAGLA